MRLIGILTCFCLAASVARAAHTQASLLFSADPAQPGTTILSGVHLKMDEGWHTYWKNPGAAGLPTKIEWHLPPGVTAGETQWPLPEIIPPTEVTTYGYEGEVVLLVPLTLAADLKPGPLVLKADVSWLECKEQCVPGKTTVEATLNIGDETKPSADAALIETWRVKVPRADTSFPFRATWEQMATNDSRSLLFELPAFEHAKWLPITGADFFPDASDNFEVQAPAEKIANPSAEFEFRKQVKKFSGDWPKEISGVMIIAHNGSREGYQVKLAIGDSASATAPGTTPAVPATTLPPEPLWKMLVYAFIGGLILNIMPCVLPVIALKILGFVSEAGSSPRRLRALGGLYAVGVLMSFVVLAAVVIGIKAAGHLAGWGMQFGNPIFLVCLTTLVALVALNLFGVFEVTLGGRALNAAGTLASKHGAAGAFFNGVLATVLATPCTAPILGTALGFAFAQGAVVVLLIFLTVGLGLAAPYVLLCWNPNWLKFLPKPGAWMEKFKIAMGFPMLATAVWLLNIAASTYGKNVLWLGIFLVVLAFAAWIFGEFFQRGRKQRGLALIITLVLLVGGYAYALEGQLRWREAAAETAATGSLKESPDGIDWQPWSPAAVAQARSEGRPVLVDFTADWCLTCQVNKKTSIEIPSVRAKLKDLNAVALIGDYTRTPDAITTELNRYARAGVPLVLVYSKDAAAPPIVLPEVLTPGIVLDALDRANKQ
ncbi:MAG TPA: protein-disulfide reductase DsbD domain-containing protein [Verrucomicrobiae bacterium]|nr:protein-disulfide reductase DsbD domain-containing protein [Verrucomicrobiae bacterium]